MSNAKKYLIFERIDILKDALVLDGGGASSGGEVVVVVVVVRHGKRQFSYTSKV